MNKPWSKRNALRRKNNIRYKNKLKDRYYNYNRYPGVSERINSKGETYYIVYSDKKVKKFLKQYSSGKVRKYKGLGKRNSYKKVFDLWWTLY